MTVLSLLNQTTALMPTFDSLADWFKWLDQAVAPPIGQRNERLQRLGVLVRALELDQIDGKVITVTGTNGKGSFVAALATLLRAKGFSTGCYTSPHMLTYKERISVNGALFDDSTLVYAFNQIAECANQHAIDLHFFELLTLTALYLFKQQPLDYWILEVGIGGRFDPVNVIAPDYGVITSIGLDHEAYLGDTREAIATEKCGILRAHTQLLNSEADRPTVLQDALLTHNGVTINEHFSVTCRDGQWLLHDGYDDTDQVLPEQGLSPFSVGAAIIMAKHILKLVFAEGALNALLSRVSLPGRFEVLENRGVHLIMDMTHNVQAAELLHKRLSARRLEPRQKRMAIFAVLQEKNLDGIVASVLQDFDAWFLGALQTPRALPASVIAEHLRQQGVSMISVSKNIRQALARAEAIAQPGDEIVIFGSSLTVSAVYPKLKKLMDANFE